MCNTIKYMGKSKNSAQGIAITVQYHGPSDIGPVMDHARRSQRGRERERAGERDR